MIISRTPYRISLLGGGTDYPGWYKHHGGEVLAGSINRYCYLTCRYLPPFFEHRFRIVYSVTEDCREICEIRHPAVRAALQMLDVKHGLEIHHDGDLPARSGIGSSSSFSVGILHALHALHGEMVSKRELADAAIQLEQVVLKENVGCQDQISAAFGGFNHVEIFQNGDYRVQPLLISHDQLLEVSANLMLFYTGIHRISSDVAATYVVDIEKRAAQLQKVQQSVAIGKKLLSRDGNLREFGELMHEMWLQKRALSTAVSRPEIDEMYAAARSAGALGGKLLGAGGGGFLLMMAPPEKQQAVRERLRPLVRVPFQFETTGSQIVFYESEKVEEII